MQAADALHVVLQTFLIYKKQNTSLFVYCILTICKMPMTVVISTTVPHCFILAARQLQLVDVYCCSRAATMKFSLQFEMLVKK